MKIAVFPGSFKPPHKGHFKIAKKIAKKVDKLIILISSKNREDITPEQSLNIWKLYSKHLPKNIEFKISSFPSPITEFYHMVNQDYNNKYIAVFGKGENSRFNNNVKVFDGGTFGSMSATNLRQAIRKYDDKKIQKFLPKGITQSDFFLYLYSCLSQVKN